MEWIPDEELDKAFLIGGKDFELYIKDIGIRVEPTENSWKEITAYLHRHSILPWLQYKEILSKEFQDFLPIVRAKGSKHIYTDVEDLLRQRCIHDPYIYRLLPLWMKRKLLEHRGGAGNILGTIDMKLAQLDRRDPSFRSGLLEGYNPGIETWVYGAMMNLDYTKSIHIEDRFVENYQIDIITDIALRAVPFQEKVSHPTTLYKGKKLTTVPELISKFRLNYNIPRGKVDIDTSVQVNNVISHMHSHPKYSPMIDDIPTEYILSRDRVINAWIISGYIVEEDHLAMLQYLANNLALAGLVYYGFSLISSKVPNTTERRKFLDSLTPEQTGLLLAMYTRPDFGGFLDVGNATEQERRNFLINIKKPKEEIEKLIKEYYGTGLEEQVLDQVESLIPPGINPKEYFASSIIWAYKIFTRKADEVLLPNTIIDDLPRTLFLGELLKFTDQEIEF